MKRVSISVEAKRLDIKLAEEQTHRELTWRKEETFKTNERICISSKPAQ
jgi:hypothetical protein